MTLKRYQVRLFQSGGSEVAFEEIVPVFHKWIREGASNGLLIDVADYKHVPNGPGIMLVGFEEDYSYGEADGRRVLSVVVKRPDGLALRESAAVAIRRLLDAADRLEREPALIGRLRFDASQIEIALLDRLAVERAGIDRKSVADSVARAIESLGAAGVSVEWLEHTDPRRPAKLIVRLANGAGEIGYESIAEAVT